MALDARQRFWVQLKAATTRSQIRTCCKNKGVFYSSRFKSAALRLLRAVHGGVQLMHPLCSPCVSAVPMELCISGEHTWMLQIKTPKLQPPMHPLFSHLHVSWCVRVANTCLHAEVFSGKDRQVRICSMDTQTSVRGGWATVNSAGLQITNFDCQEQTHFKAWFACQSLRFISLLYSSQPDSVIQCSQISSCLHFWIGFRDFPACHW